MLDIGVFMSDTPLLQDLRIRRIPGRCGRSPVATSKVQNGEMTASKVIAQIACGKPDTCIALLHCLALFSCLHCKRIVARFGTKDR